MDLPEWKGENPFFLLHRSHDTGVPAIEFIDLDESGWIAKHGHIFRSVGDIFLVRKADQAVCLSVHLNEGEQGYYVARHVGIAFGGTGETVAYGIGKKRANGNEDNLWYFPWGQVCGGNDVEYFALDRLKGA